MSCWHQEYCILSNFFVAFIIILVLEESFYWAEIKFYSPAMIDLKVTIKKTNSFLLIMRKKQEGEEFIDILRL